MTITLRLRTEPGGMTTMWLIRRVGPVESGVMYGVAHSSVAEEVAAKLEAAGVAIERSELKAEYVGEPTPETRAVKQQELFERINHDERRTSSSSGTLSQAISACVKERRE